MKCIILSKLLTLMVPLHLNPLLPTNIIEALKIRQLRLPESEKVAVTHEKIGSLARGMGKAKKAQIAFEGNFDFFTVEYKLSN